MAEQVQLDVVIFGGGAAGLWLLDELRRDGFAALLLEADCLGAGQTVASQGIIHGGLKYTLDGMLSSSARAIREMPKVWRRCLAGERKPDLAGTRLRAEFCHLWHTGRFRSRLGMLGARAGLRVAPAPLPPEAWPVALRECPGIVARLDEQVIEPWSMIEVLARRHDRFLARIDALGGLDLETRTPGQVRRVRLIDPVAGTSLELIPRHVVLLAGAGNEALLERVGLPASEAQRRPLHMVLARGALPELCGHCVDGMRTSATITTARDSADVNVWQIGGQIAEDGVEMEPRQLVAHARRELATVLPGVRLTGVEWATYRVDRAEARVHGRRRPSEHAVFARGNVIAGWPTKLALVPLLATQIRRLLPNEPAIGSLDTCTLDLWPRPDVAVPPWEVPCSWFADA